jgi:hypothetical protein
MAEFVQQRIVFSQLQIEGLLGILDLPPAALT